MYWQRSSNHGLFLVFCMPERVDDGIPFSPHTLIVRVKTLAYRMRNKIEDDPAVSQTDPGAEYKLVVERSPVKARCG